MKLAYLIEDLFPAIMVRDMERAASRELQPRGIDVSEIINSQLRRAEWPARSSSDFVNALADYQEHYTNRFQDQGTFGRPWPAQAVAVASPNRVRQRVVAIATEPTEPPTTTKFVVLTDDTETTSWMLLNYFRGQQTSVPPPTEEPVDHITPSQMEEGFDTTQVPPMRLDSTTRTLTSTASATVTTTSTFGTTETTTRETFMTEAQAPDDDPYAEPWELELWGLPAGMESEFDLHAEHFGSPLPELPAQSESTTSQTSESLSSSSEGGSLDQRETSTITATPSSHLISTTFSALTVELPLSTSREPSFLSSTASDSTVEENPTEVGAQAASGWLTSSTTSSITSTTTTEMRSSTIPAPSSTMDSTLVPATTESEFSTATEVSTSSTVESTSTTQLRRTRHASSSTRTEEQTKDFAAVVGQSSSTLMEPSSTTVTQELTSTTYTIDSSTQLSAKHSSSSSSSRLATEEHDSTSSLLEDSNRETESEELSSTMAEDSSSTSDTSESTTTTQMEAFSCTSSMSVSTSDGIVDDLSSSSSISSSSSGFLQESSSSDLTEESSSSSSDATMESSSSALLEATSSSSTDLEELSTSSSTDEGASESSSESTTAEAEGQEFSSSTAAEQSSSSTWDKTTTTDMPIQPTQEPLRHVKHVYMKSATPLEALVEQADMQFLGGAIKQNEKYDTLKMISMTLFVPTDSAFEALPIDLKGMSANLPARPAVKGVQTPLEEWQTLEPCVGCQSMRPHFTLRPMFRTAEAQAKIYDDLEALIMYHVVRRQVPPGMIEKKKELMLRTEMPQQQLEVLYNPNDESLTVGGAHVVEIVHCKNGFIYKLDRPLTPQFNPRAPTVLEYVRDNPEYSKLYYLFSHSHLFDGWIGGAGPITVLLIKDDGWRINGLPVPDCFFKTLVRPANRDMLLKILKWVTIPGMWRKGEIERSQWLLNSEAPALMVNHIYRTTDASGNVLAKERDVQAPHEAPPEAHVVGEEAVVKANDTPETFKGNSDQLLVLIEGKEVIEWNIPLHNGYAHVLSELPIRPDIDLTPVLWDCLDFLCAECPIVTKFVLKFLDNGGLLPDVSNPKAYIVPNGIRPDWVCSNHRNWFPPGWELKEWKKYIEAAKAGNFKQAQKMAKEGWTNAAAKREKLLDQYEEARAHLRRIWVMYGDSQNYILGKKEDPSLLMGFLNSHRELAMKPAICDPRDRMFKYRHGFSHQKNSLIQSDGDDIGLSYDDWRYITQWL